MIPTVNAKKLAAAACAVALACCPAGCVGKPAEEQTESTEQPGTASPAPEQSVLEQTVPMSESTSRKDEPVLLRVVEVSTSGIAVTFELNDSAAAKALYDQLPLAIAVEDFSTNEKVFYPPQPLDVTDAPHAEGGAGTLAYYEPWGDVVMFYDDYSPNGSLYELGRVVSGTEHLASLSGVIDVSAIAQHSP